MAAFLDFWLEQKGKGMESEITLLEATKKDLFEVVHSLLEAGCDPNETFDEDEGMAPIHYAVIDGLIEILKELLTCAIIDVNLRTYDGRTPLMLAVSYGRHDELQELLRHSDCDVNVGDNQWEMTALHRAADLGCEECVAPLLRSGADPKVKDKHGSTAILLAVNSENHNKNVVKALIKWGCCDGDARPLKMAFQRGELWIAAALFLGGYSVSGSRDRILSHTSSTTVTQFWESVTLPRSLMALCRLTIQSIMGLMYPVKVGTLHLPEFVANFLLFSDLDENLL